MKRIFLMTVFLAFFIQTKAQVIDSVSVDSTKKEISYKKNELGVNIELFPSNYVIRSIGINYTRFFGKQMGLQVEYASNLKNFNRNKTTVGLVWYSHPERKRLTLAANVSAITYFNAPETSYYKSNMSFYVHPEIGYNFLIKDRISIQPNISIGVGRDFNNGLSFYNFGGVRLKYRF